ncbi:MAG: type II toxin-antitoxin system RelE/ParE family toxin [Thermoanaerobaculia bacterium]
MGRVRWTEEAARWLRDIHDYIAQDSPESARRVVREIHARGESLAAFSERGYRYEDRPDRNIRILLWGHYRIAYLVRSGGDVEILGVFHGALDIRRYLDSG